MSALIRSMRRELHIIQDERAQIKAKIEAALQSDDDSKIGALEDRDDDLHAEALNIEEQIEEMEARNPDQVL